MNLFDYVRPASVAEAVAIRRLDSAEAGFEAAFAALLDRAPESAPEVAARTAEIVEVHGEERGVEQPIAPTQLVGEVQAVQHPWAVVDDEDVLGS